MKPPVPEGLTAEAWKAIGATIVDGVWRTPEQDAQGQVIGWTRRLANGKKLAMSGGARGLTMRTDGLNPYDGTSPDRPVFVVEGATDTAAALGLGLVAVGRPSATGGVALLSELLKDRYVCIVGENDSGAGRRGAESLAEALRSIARRMKVIFPPVEIKDLRAWVIAGVTQEQILDAWHAAKSLRSKMEAGRSRPIFVRLSDVQPQPVSWLWAPWIALGKLTVLAGDPGLGKSFLTIDLAARISAGTPWPGTSRLREPSDVVLLNAEDDLQDTIRPRLDDAGADSTRIIALTAARAEDGGERQFDLSRDIRQLEVVLQDLPLVKLVVVDPITAYMGATDSNDNAEVRGVLGQLAALAARYGVAVLAVSHHNKSGTRPAIYRTMGSLAFAAAARSVLAVGKDPANPRRRLLVPVKNNNGVDSGGLAYTIEASEGQGPRVVWEPVPINVTADALLNTEAGAPAGGSARSEAMRWLTGELSRGPCDVTALQAEAKAAGITDGTLRRAKEDLGVESRKSGYSGAWQWSLPPVSGELTDSRVLEEGARPYAGAHLGEAPGKTVGVGTKVRSEDDLSILEAHLGAKDSTAEGNAGSVAAPDVAA